MRRAGCALASIVAFVASTLSGGCALSPETKLEQTALQWGFESGEVQAGPFSLRYYHRGTGQRSATINIYLDGDGSPWSKPTLMAANPTPRKPLALFLMREDPRSAIYLGRPCYLGQQSRAPCNPWFWTQGRYSETVVQTMASAIESLVQRHAPAAEIRLVGHSGGGSLAVLIAERVARVVEVVTIGANLDIDAWADYRRYTRLDGSLNPASSPGLPARIRQVHFLGVGIHRFQPRS